MLGLVELVIIFSIALGLGGWQLWSVSREIRADAARRAASETAASTAPPE